MDMEEKLKIVGVRIKTARIEQNLTQKELAKIIGISASYLSKIENGKCDCNVYIIFKIIKTLDCGFEILD